MFLVPLEFLKFQFSSQKNQTSFQIWKFIVSVVGKSHPRSLNLLLKANVVGEKWKLKILLNCKSSQKKGTEKKVSLNPLLFDGVSVVRTFIHNFLSMNSLLFWNVYGTESYVLENYVLWNRTKKTSINSSYFISRNFI